MELVATAASNHEPHLNKIARFELFSKLLFVLAYWDNLAFLRCSTKRRAIRLVIFHPFAIFIVAHSKKTLTF